MASLGVVTCELRKSGDVRVTAIKGEEVIPIFKAPKGCGEVVAFVFFIEGHNPVKE